MIDQASLVIGECNWAVKEGSLLGYKLIDGKYYPREMDVVRATTGTRVNSQGLVELVPYNIFKYSEQFDNVNWDKSSGTITSNATTAPNGTTTADLFTANGVLGVHDFFQGFTGGSQTTASIYVKKNTAQYVYISLNYQGTGSDWATGIYNLDALTTATFQSGGVNNQIAIISDAGNGWRRITLKVDTANTALFCMYGVADSMSPTFSSRGRVENSSSDSFYAWGAQVVEGSVAKDYQKTETRLNIPRLDYSNGTCPSILVEPQRTNLNLYSEQFDNAAYSSSGGAGSGAVFSINYGLAPDGNMTADRVQITRGTNYWERYQRKSTTIGQVYTLSFWGKAVTGTPTLYTAWNTAYQNPVTFTNEWVRYTYTYTAAGTSTGFNLISWVNLPTTSATADVMIWGVQLEQGSYATSYIPTTSASVTRNADVISKTGISSLIGQTEGTAFIDLYVDSSFAQVNMRFLDISSNNYDNWYFLGLANTNELVVYFRSNATVYASALVPFTAGHNKIAFAYANNDYVAYVNGTLVHSDSSVVVGSTSKLTLGNDFDFSIPSKQFINASALWKTRLTNTQLANLTTI